MKKLMRGSAPKGLPAKRVIPLGRKKPRRGIASCWFRTRQETISLQGTGPEVEASANHMRVAASERMYDSAKESLEGTTPRTWPARNKAGGLRVDQDLVSVETLRRYPNPAGGPCREYVATRFCERRRGRNRKGGSYLQEKS
jgi:hypothetical protein